MSTTARGAFSRTWAMKSTSNAVWPVTRSRPSTRGCDCRMVRTRARASSLPAGSEESTTSSAIRGPLSWRSASWIDGGRSSAGALPSCRYCSRVIEGSRSTALVTPVTPGCRAEPPAQVVHGVHPLRGQRRAVGVLEHHEDAIGVAARELRARQGLAPPRGRRRRQGPHVARAEPDPGEGRAEEQEDGRHRHAAPSTGAPSRRRPGDTRSPGSPAPAPWRSRAPATGRPGARGGRGARGETSARTARRTRRPPSRRAPWSPGCPGRGGRDRAARWRR